MDPSIIENLLVAIKDAVSGNRRQDDVALPIFDPGNNDAGAASWCDHIETLGTEFGWSGIAKVAKAGKALRGSALLWFETWEPQDGRTWENFRSEIVALYPEKKNLSEKLYKAVVYSSDSADSYCEYAREKIRLLKCTKLAFSESQLVELICGGIRDNNVRMASFNSGVKTTSELIGLFTTYVKNKKRQFGNAFENVSVQGGSKRFKIDDRVNDREKVCYTCSKPGHLRADCPTKLKSTGEKLKSTPPELIPLQSRKQCTYCKKMGHDETTCFFKKNLNKPTDAQSSNSRSES